MSKSQMEGESISRFQQMCGGDEDTARGYLEACAWDLNMAVSMYLEAGGNSDYAPNPTGTSLYARRDSPAQPLNTSGGDSLPIAMNIADRSPIHAERPAEAPATGERGGPRMMSIGDLQKKDDAKGQQFYTGGHKSGMAVEDPGKKKPADIVDSVFKSAQDRSAMTKDEYDRERQKPFTGSGFRLGDNASAPSAPAPGTRPKPKSVTITFWKDGFSVTAADHAGELRSLEDPANREFLQHLNNGRVPPELSQIVGPGDVDVQLIDKKHEKYQKPKVEFKAFKGGGHKLGSDGPTYSQVQQQAVAAASAASSTSAAAAPPLDESRPVTSIQVRLADGTKLVAKFNLDALVGDLYEFVRAARPGQGSNFELRSTFPPKPFTDMSQTVEEAGLSGAVVVQRMK